MAFYTTSYNLYKKRICLYIKIIKFEFDEN